MHSIRLALSIFLLCAANIDCKKSAKDAEDVVFRLYKRDEPTEFTILQNTSTPSFVSKSFDLQLPTQIYVHGWLAKDDTIGNFREALLNAADVNLIVVDWTKNSRKANYVKVKKWAIDVSYIIVIQILAVDSI